MTGAFVVSIAIKVTVILALGLGALRFLRRSRAAVRHLFLLALSAVVLTLPLAALVVPVFAIPLRPTWSLSLPSAVPDGYADVASASASTANVVSPYSPNTSERVSFTDVLLIVEGLGATLALVPLIVGLWQTRRLRASARPWSHGQTRIERLAMDALVRRPVDVLVHDNLPGPVTCGVWHPAILFPADVEHWHDDDFDRAAIHELEHVRRHDWVTDCFARVVCAVYWFHPLIWTTWRQLRLESERAADDAVVREREAAAYADLLLTLAERLATGQPNYVIAMAGRGDLPVRIRAVLDESKPRGRAGRRSIVAAALLAAGVVLGVAPLGTLSDVSVAAAEQDSRTPQSTALSASQRLAFDVASIKRSDPDADGTRIRTEPGGRWLMRNLAVSAMIHEAYPTPGRELIGAPGWATSERYDVDAKADGNPTRDEILAMLRTLLSERFKLAVHYETHERPVYALVLARPDGKTRAGLVRSTIDCGAVAAARREGRTPDVPKPSSGAPPCAWNASYRPNGITIRFGGLPLSRFGEAIGQPDGRVIIDKTGLTGGYEFTLTFTQQPAPGDDNATLVAALEEQLGLKLVADRAPLQVLVVDHVERPTEN